MGGKRIVVIGASRLGCELALEARRAGLQVTLIDEHPQSIKSMSVDAPYFYGNGLPAALRNRVAVFDSVLGSNEPLLACVEAEADVKIGTVAWGVFQNAPNSRHIGTPKVGIVLEDGNDMVEYDHLVLATGSRDFVPSFRGWELPGVFGVEAGRKLLTAYQCYDGTRTLILGTTAEAVAFARCASERGIEIAGFVEPTDTFQAPSVERAWVESQNIAVLFNMVIEGANGRDATRSATLVPTSPEGASRDVPCDTICVAIGKLPNIEIPATLGCELAFSEHFGTWLPVVSDRLETTRPNIYWLSSYNRRSGQVACLLDAIRGTGPSQSTPETEDSPGPSPAAYLRTWIGCLLKSGGRNITLCQCESVSRADLLELSPPRYLARSLRQAKSPVLAEPDGAAIDQNLVKRMTRVGMGHCQGKRCRDEAALLLSETFGVDLARIKPATYRFPVRPIDLPLIAAEDDTIDTRERWPHWLEPYVQGE
jgi:thioredoxin reductase